MWRILVGKLLENNNWEPRRRMILKYILVEKSNRK
jgi:hypothetical protein